MGDKFSLRQLKSIVVDEKRYGRERLVATHVLLRREPTCTTSYGINDAF